MMRKCPNIKMSLFCLLRIASLSKIFPTLMLYKLWEDGKIGSLDDPLEKFVENFTIKNPLGKMRDSELKYVTDGLIFLDSGEVPIRSSSVTLRRMASQLSGSCTGLYGATLSSAKCLKAFAVSEIQQKSNCCAIRTLRSYCYYVFLFVLPAKNISCWIWDSLFD